MSNPANDDLSQHLSDGEESNHKDASDTGAAPKPQQQMIPQTTAISNIKLPILKKEEYDIWAIEMEHYLEYIDNEVWKRTYGEDFMVDDANNEYLGSPSEQGLKRDYDRLFNSVLFSIFFHPSNYSTNVPEKEVLAGFADEENLFLLSPKQTEDSDLLHVGAKGTLMERRKRGLSFSTSRQLGSKRRIDGLSNEVSLCSKTCIDSYNKLKTLFDEQMSQLGDQEAQILAYSLAVKKLEAQLVTSQKQQLSLNEKLAFQANEIHEKDKKLKRYRRIGMKAVKEKEQLQKIVDSWKDSSKNLWRLINSGMSSNDKLGLGFEIQSNDEVLSYEEEMNFSVFKCSKEDSVGKPSYSRFTKSNDFKGVPPPLSGDYTPQPQEEIDDALYVYGKKGPQKPKISVSNDNSFEHSTCQSNDSEGSCGNTTEHSFETELESLDEPNEISKSRQPLKDKETHQVDRKNWNDMMKRELGDGYSFTKKKCFVCGSLNHLIKDCDYYEKKLAREAEEKRVVNTGNGVTKPVWTNISSGRSKVNYVSPKVNSVSPKVNYVSPKVNFVSPKVNTVRPRQTEHPLKNMVDRGIFDSGCSGHMTGNKDQLEDFEEFNGGSVTFGGSKGYISGKGRIRVGNLDFDSVSFVKELGHFNLFSISQICDKQHKVLFTETECLVVSSDFKMPDENQILLKVPRHHNMYSFDMKTPSSTKGFACLIAKATSDESKLWHRRLGHINFKNLNKLVKGNLVRGLPSKVFKNDHTCVACHKGKQHRASCKAKLERLITKPLHTLHMDLFGPTSVKSINHASYCLVIIDDCTRFCWVFFLASKDETSGILQTFIRQIENLLSHKVKIIRSDNGTEFKNRDMLEFCGNKGIKQEFSNARTPQQNGVLRG
ncbi:putative ribonuclease H-like domain-containing protein [Tanacetum coccineum]